MTDERTPHYFLSAKDRDTGKSHKVGAAWINEEHGSISISIDRFVVLDGSQNMTLMLFPNEKMTKRLKPNKNLEKFDKLRKEAIEGGEFDENGEPF